MSTVIDRLRFLRQKAGFTSARQAATAYGIGYETYKKIEAGERGLTEAHALKIAHHQRVPAGWLLYGEGSPRGGSAVPLIGYIGAGQEMIEFETIEDGGHVPAGFDSQDTIAFEVQGDSMYPIAYHGDLAYFGHARRDVLHLIGHECAVLLEDGRRFFKILGRGSKAGLFELRSYNAAPISDVQVHSAAPFRGVVRRNWPRIRLPQQS